MEEQDGRGVLDLDRDRAAELGPADAEVEEERGDREADVRAGGEATGRVVGGVDGQGREGGPARAGQVQRGRGLDGRGHPGAGEAERALTVLDGERTRDGHAHARERDAQLVERAVDQDRGAGRLGGDVDLEDGDREVAGESERRRAPTHLDRDVRGHLHVTERQADVLQGDPRERSGRQPANRGGPAVPCEGPGQVGPGERAPGGAVRGDRERRGDAVGRDGQAAVAAGDRDDARDPCRDVLDGEGAGGRTAAGDVGLDGRAEHGDGGVPGVGECAGRDGDGVRPLAEGDVCCGAVVRDRPARAGERGVVGGERGGAAGEQERHLLVEGDRDAAGDGEVHGAVDGQGGRGGDDRGPGPGGGIGGEADRARRQCQVGDGEVADGPGGRVHGAGDAGRQGGVPDRRGGGTGERDRPAGLERGAVELRVAAGAVVGDRPAGTCERDVARGQGRGGVAEQKGRVAAGDHQIQGPGGVEDGVGAAALRDDDRGGRGGEVSEAGAGAGAGAGVGGEDHRTERDLDATGEAECLARLEERPAEHQLALGAVVGERPTAGVDLDVAEVERAVRLADLEGETVGTGVDAGRAAQLKLGGLVTVEVERDGGGVGLRVLAIGGSLGDQLEAVAAPDRRGGSD
ncbi:hypothetical protein GCM10023169_13380 [Georgenia halophila]|uniref:Uncharacterized protein n=1 Tax=Georgenia halophila TaxID=620889 RepID=A0ABP8L2A6_9MICO